MDSRLSPGTLCTRRGDPSERLVLVEQRGERFACARQGSDAALEVPASALEPVGRDDAAARVLGLRWRSASAARTFPPGQRVRTGMVLCAGLGTRLRPLTLRYPKPALPFFDGPLVRYSFALLKQAGIERVVINTHHLPEVMEQEARTEAARLGLELAVSHEPVIQGTGGGVRDARRLLGDEPFVLLNGDAFMSLDLRALIGAHESRGDAATMAVVPMPPTERFNAVEATAEGAVRRVAGLGLPDPAPDSWHFVGAQVVSPQVFDFIPPQGEQDILRAAYLPMVRAGLPVRVCPVALGAWADLGTPRRYLQACEELLTGLCDLAPLGAHAPLSQEEQQRLRAAPVRSWIHPTARSRAQLDGWAVVGSGAEVGEARLRASAVLPDTIVGSEVLADVIASGELRLPAE